MQFKGLGLSEMAYATGLTLNIYSGKFLYTAQNNPSNFSCFSVHEGTHLDKEEQQNRQLMLHLIETKGKGQSIKEIKTLNKQKIKAPTTYIDMMQQLAGFKGLTTFFFGKYSFGNQAIALLMSYIERCKTSFKARERTDAKFCSKFLYAIDTHFQLWLEECSNANRRNRVDDNLLNFRSLIKAVRFGTFELNLPSSFSEPEPKDPIINSSPNKGGGKSKENEGNKNKNKGKKTIKRIVNASPPPGFKLAQGETWGISFAKKNIHIHGRVTWEGDCKMCPRWFINGYCFDNCINAGSHVESRLTPKPKSPNSMTSCRSSETATIDSTGWDLAVSDHPRNHQTK
jgi:hypothetical protein